MNLLKLLLLIALAGAGWHYWNQQQAQADLAGHTSPQGFLAIPMPTGFSGRGVVIFAPPNCPSEAAQRADALAAALAGRGVPVQRASSAQFELADRASAARVQAVMGGTIPVVFVDGRGKANPSLQEVLAELGR